MLADRPPALSLWADVNKVFILFNKGDNICFTRELETMWPTFSLTRFNNAFNERALLSRSFILRVNINGLPIEFTDWTRNEQVNRRSESTSERARANVYLPQKYVILVYIMSYCRRIAMRLNYYLKMIIKHRLDAYIQYIPILSWTFETDRVKKICNADM